MNSFFELIPIQFSENSDRLPVEELINFNKIFAL